MSKLIQYSKTDLYQEITDHLLGDEKPSEYIKSLSNQKELQGPPFHALWELKKVEQSKKYHPEGSVWNHTMLVLDEAAKVREQSKHPAAFMWAVLLHDIGKPPTRRVRKGRITTYDHDIEGEKISAEFLRYFDLEEDFIKEVTALVRYHMHMLYVLKDLPYGDMRGLLEKVDIEDMALLCRCDRLGRTGVSRDEVEEDYQKFLKILMKEYELQYNN